jgi:hypothetical protein
MKSLASYFMRAARCGAALALRRRGGLKPAAIAVSRRRPHAYAVALAAFAPTDQHHIRHHRLTARQLHRSRDSPPNRTLRQTPSSASQTGRDGLLTEPTALPPTKHQADTLAIDCDTSRCQRDGIGLGRWPGPSVARPSGGAPMRHRPVRRSRRHPWRPIRTPAGRPRSISSTAWPRRSRVHGSDARPCRNCPLSRRPSYRSAVASLRDPSGPGTRLHWVVR